MATVTKSTEDARDDLRDLIDAVNVRRDRIIITRYRKPVAVLLSYEEAVRLEPSIADATTAPA